MSDTLRESTVFFHDFWVRAEIHRNISSLVVYGQDSSGITSNKWMFAVRITLYLYHLTSYKLTGTVKYSK